MGLTLGYLPALSLADARDLARGEPSKVFAGGDPQGAKMRAREAARHGATIKELADDFLASREAARWRPRTRYEFARIINREILPAFGTRDGDPPEETFAARRDAQGQPFRVPRSVG